MNELVGDEQKAIFISGRDEWLKKKKPNWFFSMMAKRLKNDDDVLLCLGGQRRSGKSTLGVMSCLYCDPLWTPWDNMFFKIEDAIEKVQNSRKGMALFWDEIGTDYTAYRFMSTESVSATSMFEMIGDKNLMLVMTAPSFMSFAKGGRKCVTHYISVRRIRGSGRGYARVFQIWLDDWTNKVGRNSVCDFHFYQLPKQIYETYDIYKRNYLNDYLTKSREHIFLSSVRSEVSSRIYEVFYAIYSFKNGLTHKELIELFPKSTADLSVKILKEQGRIVKNGELFRINPDIVPKTQKTQPMIVK